MKTNEELLIRAFIITDHYYHTLRKVAQICAITNPNFGVNFCSESRVDVFRTFAWFFSGDSQKILCPQMTWHTILCSVNQQLFGQVFSFPVLITFIHFHQFLWHSHLFKIFATLCIDRWVEEVFLCVPHMFQTKLEFWSFNFI